MRRLPILSAISLMMSAQFKQLDAEIRQTAFHGSQLFGPKRTKFKGLMREYRRNSFNKNKRK